MDRTDRWHAPVLAWWQAAPRDVLLPVTVLPEIAYLVHTRIGLEAEEEFVRAVAGGEFETEPLEPEDCARAADLLNVYRDLALGFVDASLVAMAERLGIERVLTTDRRHFSVVRPRHVERLRLEP